MRWRCRKDGYKTGGQITTETMFLVPVFLLLAFAAIQIAHIGLGVAMVNYATASVARQAVQNNTTSLNNEKFKSFMIAGLKDEEVRANLDLNTSSEVLQDLTAVGCAKLNAYPFVGEMLKASWKGAGINDGCSASAPWISITGSSPYKFVIRAKTTVRMNYKV